MPVRESVWIRYGRAAESKALDSRDRVLAQDRLVGGCLSTASRFLRQMLGKVLCPLAGCEKNEVASQ